MSKSGINMVLNQYWSTLDYPLLLCPTSKDAFLNPVISFRVGDIIMKPPSFERCLPNSAPPLHQV